MPLRSFSLIPSLCIAATLLLTSSGFGLAPPSDDTVSAQFSERVQPFLRKYCESCHSGADPEAKLDITSIRNVEGIAAAWTTWETMITRIDEKEMPPKDASPQPSQEERQAIKAWASQHRRSEAERQRGDPGPLSTRRLSNAEYNHVIRDLTGYDIRPTQDFPVDPANEAGFDNSGESLTMSPSLVVKYLDAAKVVANHMLLVPDGIRFAPHPVVTDTDRDKYSVQRIVDFYHAQPTAIEDYLWAAWKIQTEIGTQADPIAIERVANDLHLSRKYLHTVWNALVATETSYGPIGKLRQRWKEVTQITEGERAKEACKSIRQWIQEERSRLQPTFENLKGPGINGGSQPLVLWKNRQMANHRRSCRLSHPLSETDRALLAPEDRQAYQDGTSERQRQIVQSYQDFCSIFPDSFYVSERGRAHIDAKESEREGKGRLLSAGFHSMMGYFRDDKPLCELLLDEAQLQRLNLLWEELDFISLAPIRQYSGFIWFERAESSFINEETFHFVRAEDRSANSDEMIRRFADAYIEKLRRKEAAPTVIEAVDFHFRDMQRQIRGLEAKLRSAEEAQLRSLLAFAEEAFRKPLDPQGRKGIEDFYVRSRQLPGADHRSAMEDTLTSILMSPSFLYRWDLQNRSGSVQPLSDIDLASRLSFFVWASGPDRPLLERALRLDLHSDEAILQETRRMLRDSRRKGMLVEFLGNWLDFRRFDQHNGVDRDLFSSFDDALRESMWKEPTEYVSEIMNRDGGLRELLLSDHVVVDRNLAKHYALSWSEEAKGTWRRIDGVQEHQRGGLASMAIFLTQNSPGQRTSPVKRGYWVVRKLLGEKIPPPPPAVPELPASEKDLGEKTLRELLEKHRENASCAACHRRFDAVGLLLEGFDPIGRPRTNDLGGRAISDDALLPNGLEAKGLKGLQHYLEHHRYDDFRRHFCQSLIAYGLGRSLVVSDDLLVEEMITAMKQNDDRLSVAWEVLVLSKPFRTKRGER